MSVNSASGSSTLLSTRFPSDIGGMAVLPSQLQRPLVGHGLSVVLLCCLCGVGVTYPASLELLLCCRCRRDDSGAVIATSMMHCYYIFFDHLHGHAHLCALFCLGYNSSR